MGIISEADILTMIKSLGQETAGVSETIVLSGPYTKTTVYAVVDIGSRTVTLADGQVAARYPTALVRTSDIIDFIDPGEVAKDGTFAYVRETQYRVLDHQPDKHGFSTLVIGRDE